MTITDKSLLFNATDSFTYQVTGNLQSKIAVLLIHGLASNMTRWSEFVEYTELKQIYRLVRIDLRGHGKSITYSRVTMFDWCLDIGALCVAEGIQQFIIIGHSLGAQTALHYAKQNPSKVAGMVLIDPVFPDTLKGILSIVRRFRYLLLVPIYGLILMAKLQAQKKSYPYRDLHALDVETRQIIKNHADIDIARLYMKPSSDLEFIPLLNYLQDMFEVTRKIPDLDNISNKILVLLSSGASVSNIETTKKKINQFPDSQCQFIDANHWLLTEKPVESRHAIDNWCKLLM